MDVHTFSIVITLKIMERYWDGVGFELWSIFLNNYLNQV